MKLPLLFAALLAFSPGLADSTELAFLPVEGRVLARTFDARAEYHLADVAFTVNGEALESDEELPEGKLLFHELISVTDTLGPVSGGRVESLVRHFDELLQETTDSAQGEDSTTTLSSPLEGENVVFRWDEEEERYSVAGEGDFELDAGQAEWLAEDLDLRAVLPPGEVEPGDEWEVAPELYLAFMWPSGLLDFVNEGEEPDAEERLLSAQTIERLAGSGRAKLAEVREEDGRSVAVLEVQLEITTGSLRELEELEEDGELLRPAMTIEIEIERELVGTILWDITNGHALSAEFECEASRLETSAYTMSGEDEEGNELTADIEQSQLLEGTIRYVATIEPE